MSNNPSHEEPQVPWVVSLFAPWRMWARMRPWKRWTLAVCMLAGAYIEFPVFAIAMIHRRGGLPDPIEQTFAVVWYPIDQLIQASPTVATFYYWQAQRIFSLLSWLGL